MERNYRKTVRNDPWATHRFGASIVKTGRNRSAVGGAGSVEWRVDGGQSVLRKNFNARPLNAELNELIETSYQECETKVRIKQVLKCLRISCSSWYSMLKKVDAVVC